MVALVNDDVAIVADAVLDDTLSHQALYHGDVQLAGGPPSATVDVVPTAKERPKEGNLGVRRRSIINDNSIHLRLPVRSLQ